MDKNNQEIEIKIKNTDPQALREKILAGGGKKLSDDFQHDTMYDDGKGFFHGTTSTPPKVLRLRKTSRGNRLTYKEILPELVHDHMLKRTEIETAVENYDAMDAIIRKLGFTPYRVKEKKYEDYELDGLKIEFHQVPFLGDFIEIEASEDELEALLPKIGFAVTDGIGEDYSGLFARYCKQHNLPEETPMTFQEEKKHSLQK